MGLRDDIWNFFANIFGDRPTEPGGSQLGSSIDAILTLILIIAVLFVLYVIFRGIRHMTSYAGSGEELFSWKLHIMGKSMVKGNLNVHEYLTESELNMLEKMKEPEINESAKSYRKRHEDKELFVYDFRITDYDEAWDLKGGRDSLILAPVPLDSSKYSWMDDKGDRSIVSPTFRQKSRNVFAFITSEYKPDFVDPYGKLKDIYELVVIPKDLAVKMIDGKAGYEISLNMTKLGDAEGDAYRAEYLKTIAESYKRIEPAEHETDRLRDVLHEKDVELSDVHREREDERHQSYPEPIIGHKIKKSDFTKGSIIGIVMVAVVMGGLGYGLPELVPPLQGIIEPFMGVGIMMLMMWLLVNAYYERKPQKEKEEMGIA